MFAVILLSPTLGTSFQAGNHSAKSYYSIGVQMLSHQPAVVVTRVPYSLKYDALFQPEATGMAKTATSSVIGRSTSGNVTLVQMIAHASTQLPRIGQSMTSPPSGKYAVNLTNNMTALNLANQMLAEQTRNSTIPSITNSSFKVVSP
jgi:hypothetical protein